MLAAVTAHIPAMQAQAAELDAIGRFPRETIARLASAGLLAAPLPEAFGGLGAGTEPRGAGLVYDLLRAFGRGPAALAGPIGPHRWRFQPKRRFHRGVQGR